MSTLHLHLSFCNLKITVMQDIEQAEQQLGFTRDSPWKHLDFTCGQGGLCIQASHVGSARNDIYSVCYNVLINLSMFQEHILMKLPDTRQPMYRVMYTKSYWDKLSWITVYYMRRDSKKVFSWSLDASRFKYTIHVASRHHGYLTNSLKW